MANKLYAGEIVNVTTFDKPLERDGVAVGGPNVSYLVRVYGEYDALNPETLHQFAESVLCTFALGVDHPKVEELLLNSRLALPASGIIEEAARTIKDRRTGEDVGVHRFRALHRHRIVVVNNVAVMTHDIRRTTTSKVMAKAGNKGLVQSLKDAAKSLFKAVVN
jgi:hypothetical protein